MIISAEEARNLMPENQFNIELDKLVDRIKNAAKAGRGSLRLGAPLISVNGDSCSLTDVGERVVKAIEKKGFSVDSFYECRQFVDVGYRVSWELPS